jgi:acyl-coenzyme A synthetase/AMP-(fatty) acid ligase
MNQHRTLVNRLGWLQRAWRLGADEAVLGRTSLSFDGSVRETFWPWSVGARVVMAGPEEHRDPDHLLELIRREHIGTVTLVPSLLQVLLEHPEVESCSGLRQVVCAGEALPGALLHRFKERLPHVAIHNLYGPSEAATAVAETSCTPEGARATVPIGRPTGNVRIYLLDGAGRPVPVGVPGEMYIGGVGVVRGYLDRSELTAERFVPDSFAGTPGARLYRTGDLARWLPEGRVEFLGRNDFQVKIRGFRIELGEIEGRLVEHPGVSGVVVTAREDSAGDRCLVAYYVGSEAAGAEALRAHLSERLPEYMVPAAYVRLEALPLTPNGKLDRKALPAPEGDAYASREYEAPEGKIEVALAQIWTELLGVEQVGRRDHFFELGGHSLLALQVVSRVRQVMDLELELAAVFQHPVLAALAERILELRLARFDPETLARLAQLVRQPGAETVPAREEPD